MSQLAFLPAPDAIAGFDRAFSVCRALAGNHHPVDRQVATATAVTAGA